MFATGAKGRRLYNRLARGCYLQIHDDVPRAIPTADLCDAPSPGLAALVHPHDLYSSNSCHRVKWRASSRRRKSFTVSKAIAIWALSFTRLEANRNLLTAMRLLPKSIHRCRRYPTKFNSGRDIPAR